MTFLNRAHRVAVICGATPLLLGTAVFVVWLATRWDWLIVAGAVVFYGGLALVSAAAIALLISFRMASRQPDVPRRRVWKSTWFAAALLPANFVAAAGIIAIGLSIATRYTVVVHNASPQRLDGVQVSGGGCEAPYGSLLPGATARRTFWIQRDGSLILRASSSAGALEQTIDDYVTVNLGGHLRVTVRPDQTIDVVRVAARDLTLIDRVGEVAIWRERSRC